MSAALPKIKRKLATVSEKALAGHVDDAAGMSRSLTSVGRMTVKPDTKYSYQMSARRQAELEKGITERTWDMEIEKTKPISAHNERKTSGLCLPSRSSRASRDSSPAGDPPGGEFPFSKGPGDVGLATSS